jgi:hypothetical protein
MSGRVADLPGPGLESTGDHAGDRGHAGVSERAPDHLFLLQGSVRAAGCLFSFE